MTSQVTSWRTDDPCPICGGSLIAADDSNGNQIGQDCRRCGWSATWQTALDLTPSAPDDTREA